MKVAACKYPIGEPGDFAAFASKQEALLREAKSRGAQLAVLPEYLALELAAMFDAATRGDLHASLAAIQPLRETWLALFADLARELDLHITAGSFLIDNGHGRYRNRSDFFAPDGGRLWQDKLRLTGFEKKTGVIESGDALKVFEVDGVRAGIAASSDPSAASACASSGVRGRCTPLLHQVDTGSWLAICAGSTAGAASQVGQARSRTAATSARIGRAITGDSERLIASLTTVPE